MEKILRHVTWWKLERYIDHADEWVEEGVSYDTKEEAEADIAEYREFYPDETYRLVEYDETYRLVEYDETYRLVEYDETYRL